MVRHQLLPYQQKRQINTHVYVIRKDIKTNIMKKDTWLVMAVMAVTAYTVFIIIVGSIVDANIKLEDGTGITGGVLLVGFVLVVWGFLIAYSESE